MDRTWGWAGYSVFTTSAGQARLTGPEPGTVVLRWQPMRVTTGATLQLQTQGTLQGLPMAWVDALGIGGTPAAASRPMQPLLARMDRHDLGDLVDLKRPNTCRKRFGWF